MKLIAQINIFFPLDLRYLSEIQKQNKYSTAITIYVKMTSLLPSILDRSMASTNTMNIYGRWCYSISNNLPREKTVM